MASENEVQKLLMNLVLADAAAKGLTDREWRATAQGNYFRIGEQVFRISVDNMEQFDKAPDGEAERFMDTMR